MAAALIAAAAAPIVGGLVGNLMGQSDRNSQRSAMKRALSELKAIGYPPDLSKEIIFKEFERAGIYTPELEQEIQIAESELGNVQEDQSLRDTQRQALEMLKQRGQVGLSAEDRAALNQVRGEVQRDSEAKRQQILQQMQARGMGGSGAELMAQLQSAQGASDQAATGSDAVMAQAQERALRALSESGQMAGQVRGQDFDVNSTRARALDERNRMLAENSVSRQARNVGNLNEAQRLNLTEQQRINDANVQMQNAEKLRQNAEQGSYFDRKLGLAQAKSNAQVGQAGFYGQQAQQTQNMFAGIGQGIGQGAGAYAQNQQTAEQNELNRQAETRTGRYASSDENMKNDISYSDDEVVAWMDRIAKHLKGKK